MDSFRLIACAFCLFFAAGITKAENVSNKSIKSNHAVKSNLIRMVTGDFPPFTGVELANGGLMTQIVRMAFHQQGIETTVAFKPWKRGYRDTLKGAYQVTFPYSKSSEREQAFLYSDPILLGQLFFYTHLKSSLEYRELKDLNYSTLCLPLGFNLFPPLAKAVDEGLLRLIRASNIKDCFLMVHSKRADFTLVRKEVANQILNHDLKSFRQEFRQLDKVFSAVSEHLIVSRDQHNANEIVRVFNAGLEQLKRTGQFQKILLGQY